MMKRLVVIMAILAISSISSAVLLDDTWVREDSADSNRNSEGFMNARTDTDADDNDVCLLRFDLSGGVMASGNSLNLFWYRNDGSTGKTLSLYGLNETHPDETGWSETTVTYNNTPGLLPDGLNPTEEGCET